MRRLAGLAAVLMLAACGVDDDSGIDDSTVDLADVAAAMNNAPACPQPGEPLTTDLLGGCRSTTEADTFNLVVSLGYDEYDDCTVLYWDEGWGVLGGVAQAGEYRLVDPGLLCGDDDAGPPPTTAPLRPAGEVIAEQAIDGALDVGASATVGDLTVTVSEMIAAPDDGGFRLAVTMRVENSTDEAQSAPEVSIICTGNPDGGGYQVESTMQAGEELPPGTFLDATQYLLLPGDARTGETVPPCAEPAVVEVGAIGAFVGEVPASSWLIPAGLLPTV